MSADATMQINRSPAGSDASTRVSPAREFFGRPTTWLFLGIFVVIAAFCFLGPLVAPDPQSAAFEVLHPPSVGHLAGTDALGRDAFARLAQGGQVSIIVGITVALACLIFGVVVGGFAGFYGGVVDLVLSRISDFFQVVPSIILALVAVAILGQDLVLIIIVLSVTHWPIVARIVRAECTRLGGLGFVESAKAAGFSPLWILRSEVLPNAFAPALVATTMTVGRAILAESALSFLGLGDANKPSWGALLFDAQAYMGVAWWLAVLPGAGIFAIVLAANMLGDNLNDSLNPLLSRVK